MDNITKDIKQIDFRKGIFKGTLKTVQKTLKEDYDRDITVEAIGKAYQRGDTVVFNLVKKEIQRKIEQKQKTIKDKEKFEKQIKDNLVGA